LGVEKAACLLSRWGQTEDGVVTKKTVILSKGDPFPAAPVPAGHTLKFLPVNDQLVEFLLQEKKDPERRH